METIGLTIMTYAMIAFGVVYGVAALFIAFHNIEQLFK